MKILHRYVLREHLGPLVFAATAVTSLMLLNYIARSIGELVGKGLPWSVLGEFVGLSIPFTVAMTLPMAVLVAVLYAFSRLASENEITAMKASGVGLSTILLPVIIAGFGVSLLMIGFNDQVLPRANHRLRTLQGDIARKKPTFALRPRVINEVSPGKFYLVAGRLDQSSNDMRDIVIYDLGDPSKRRTIYADSGVMALAPNGDLELTLFNGSIAEIKKAVPTQLQRVFYVVDRVVVPGVGNQLTRSTNDTYKSEREMSICELQRVVADNELAYRASQAEIEQALVSAVRAAATGAPIPPTPPPRPTPAPFGRAWTPGRIYCELVRPLFGVPAAQAQGAPPLPGMPPTQTPPPAPQHVLPRMGTPPVIVLAGLTSTVDGARARMDTDRRTEWTYDVEVQKKFAIAMACAVFVILGAPIALRFPRGGVGLVIGVSFAVFALYYVGLIAGEPLAQNGTLTPFIAMWCSNILFTVVGLFMLTRVSRVGSSTRSGDWAELLETVRTRALAFVRVAVPRRARA